MKKNYIILMVGILFSCQLTAQNDNESETFNLSIRVTPEVGYENKLIFDQVALREIAELTEPQTLEIDAGTEILSIFKSKYAYALTSMWPILLEANPTIKSTIKTNNIIKKTII